MLSHFDYWLIQVMDRVLVTVATYISSSNLSVDSLRRYIFFFSFSNFSFTFFFFFSTKREKKKGNNNPNIDNSTMHLPAGYSFGLYRSGFLGSYASSIVWYISIVMLRRLAPGMSRRLSG